VDSTADTWSTGTGATALTRSPQTLTILFTDPNDASSGTQHSMTFQMSSVQFMNPKRNVGKEYTEIEVEFTAVANTTDAATGYAPVKFTAVNAVSTAY
jgi:hypothetical protein